MGGCRCTYKNCTVRSDGKTHLFHYPVFDKVRCHEWLSKAGRYDFLNLKVSQLKNRCICQHHFADHWFMNDNKEKLKLKAVPTLDGPYCDSSKFKDPEMPQNMLGLYPLACEVIENEDFLDRKSNYNIVYADFLTNSDMMEHLQDSSIIAKVKEDDKNFIDIENVTPATNNNIAIIGYKSQNANSAVSKTKLNSKPKKFNMDSTQEIVIEVPPVPVKQNNANLANSIKVELPPLLVEPNNTNVSKTGSLPIEKKKSRVRIISEKKITEPEKRICVPVSNAAFEVVKPSMILNISKSRAKSKPTDMMPQSVDAKDPNMLNNTDKSMAKERIVTINDNKVDQVMLNDMVLNPCKEEESNITEILATNDPSKFEINVNLNETNLPEKKPTNQKITPRYCIKNKMSPERVAAINEKRKFNMRLKDIIAEELNRLDEQASGERGNSLLIRTPKKITNKKKPKSETVLSSLSKDPSLPNDHAYIVHYLEARMERMENLLLNKIDQNTRKIMDLKKTFETQEEENEPVTKRSLRKTKLSDVAHKRQLYKEISKYLTPDSKSLVYEELFINKYDPNELKTTSPKRKRNR